MIHVAIYSHQMGTWSHEKMKQRGLTPGYEAAFKWLCSDSGDQRWVTKHITKGGVKGAINFLMLVQEEDDELAVIMTDRKLTATELVKLTDELEGW